MAPAYGTGRAAAGRFSGAVAEGRMVSAIDARLGLGGGAFVTGSVLSCTIKLVRNAREDTWDDT